MTTKIHKPTDREYLLNYYVSPLLVIGLLFLCLLDIVGVFG